MTRKQFNARLWQLLADGSGDMQTYAERAVRAEQYEELTQEIACVRHVLAETAAKLDALLVEVALDPDGAIEPETETKATHVCLTIHEPAPIHPAIGQVLDSFRRTGSGSAFLPAASHPHTANGRTH